MNALRTLSTGAPARPACRAAMGVLALGLLTLAVAIFGTMALCACGGSGDSAGSTVSPTPGQTVTPPPAPPAVSRWQSGADDLDQTRVVARAYLEALMDGEMVAQADRLYAADATLDNWIDRTHVDDVDAIKEVWEEWQQGLIWPRNPDRFVVRVVPGAVVFTVSTWSGGFGVEYPYIDFLAVSDGKVVQDEVYGDPHVTETPTKGAPDGADDLPELGEKDTAERSAAVALKFSEIISQSGDYPALRKLCAPDVVALDTSQRRPLRGVDAVIAWHKRTTRIPGADSVTVEPPIAGRGWAALRVTVNGISTAGTGHMPGAILLDIRNGKIVRVIHYYDSTVLDLSP
jgi:ketosteroid isomerase-like protein